MANDAGESQSAESQKKGGPTSSEPETSFKNTVKKIKKEQHDSGGKSQHAKKIADLVLKARNDAGGGLPDPTDVLKVFKPIPSELKARGLPEDFLDKKLCSNNTVLFMADFTFEE